MITYQELENLRKSWDGEVCIFGAGQIGKGKAYELIKAAGFSIDFYCDNHISPGTYIRDDLIVRDIKYLYEHNKDIFVFLCVSTKYQREILEQLENHDVKNIVKLDTPDFIIEQIMEEVDKASDEVKKRWHYFYDDKEFLSRVFKRQMGYDLDIEHPKTFNEKLQWLKLHDRNSAYIQMVDKYAVKEYIAQKIGEEYVIPTLGVYETFDEIAFEKLPDQFVLKCTHDSGSVVICRDKKNFNMIKVKEVLQSKLKRNLYWMGREWPYKNVRPRIIAEMFMKDKAAEDLIDFKFYCFHGEPKFLYVSAGLENHATARISFYNLDLSEAVFQRSDFKHFAQLPKIPTHYQEMIDVARKLSEGIPFVRIDLYEINEKVYFSEFTFTPSAGWMPFESYKWDLALGELLDLARVL